jgi:long-chain acyl-CoA synthetase
MTDGDLDPRDAPTVLHAALARARREPDRPSLRYRGDAGWVTIPWKEHVARIERLAAGLAERGIGAGDRVAILGTNRPEWMIADLAVLALRAASVPIYPNNVAAQVRYIVTHARCKGLIVFGRDQWDKVGPWADEVPVRVFAGGDLPDGATALANVEGDGADRVAAGAFRLADAVDRVMPDDLATVVYTSGTTANPKGVMLTHANAAWQMKAVLSVLPMDGEETISFLPLSHIAERLQGEFFNPVAGNVVSFAQSFQTVLMDLLEVRPTLLTCVPRMWEKIHEGIARKMAGRSAFARALFAWGLRVGSVAAGYRTAGRRVPLPTALAFSVADRLVFRKVRAGLGMDRCRVFISGGAPLQKRLVEFFSAMGMDIHEVYGMTETFGSICFPPKGRIRPGTVGPPLPGLELTRGDDGEVLVRGGNVFLGYWDDPESTRAALAGERLHTGDVATVDEDGYVSIVDRVRDLIVTSGGSNVAPAPIEARLRAVAGVDQAVVVGHGRNYVAALVFPAPDAKRNGTALERGIAEAIEAINGGLAAYARVKRYRVVDAVLTVETGELTPTLKVKRRVVEERFAAEIAALYA